ncbi:MAG3450 family membrane protein [Mycoplasma sp. 5370]
MRITKVPSWLFTILIVIIPILVIYFLFSPEIQKKEIIEYKYLCLIGLSYVVLSFIIITIFVYLKVLKINFFNFNFPLILSLFVILITYQFTEYWIILRIFLIILCSFSIIPIMLVTAILNKKNTQKANFSKK